MALFTVYTTAYSCLFLVGAAILKIILTGLFNPRSHVPGPWYTRFTAIPAIYLGVRGNRFRWVHRLHAVYGPIVRVSPDEVSVVDIEAWAQVHKMGSEFRKTPFHESLRIGPDKSIFGLSNVKEHAQRRKLYTKAFTASSLRENWEDDIAATVEFTVSRIKSELLQTGTADVFKWWRLMTSDVITMLAFGESFGMLDRGEVNELYIALQDVGTNVVLRDKLPFLKALPWVPWRRLRDILRCNEIITRESTAAVRNLRKTDLGRGNLFTNILANAEEGDRTNLTDNAIRSDAATFFFAGADTTSVSLTYIVWAVLKRPELQKRLEDEVAGLPDGFKDDELERLVLLNSTIDEALRLYGPASDSVRRLVPPDGVVLCGTHLPPKTIVSTLGFSIHRNPSVFVNPEDFDETRFQNITPDQKRAFAPFGRGARSCIGINVARMELRRGIALFFRECRGVRLAPGMTDEDMVMKINFVGYPTGGKCVIANRLSNGDN
ncbi:hypothetical protein O9K51_10033 [Purpureocillium lavendulum]|uniref:Cytochrome P450 n=1 Tax=Purpureocillium lavendulum TaxID=1247861 RepID=A0AB34FGJ7_9HYPO|nr:hypothetical protein O9K51_10033 [Purpureocillium lavendulum]